MRRCSLLDLLRIRLVTLLRIYSMSTTSKSTLCPPKWSLFSVDVSHFANLYIFIIADFFSFFFPFIYINLLTNIILLGHCLETSDRCLLLHQILRYIPSPHIFQRCCSQHRYLDTYFITMFHPCCSQHLSLCHRKDTNYIHCQFIHHMFCLFF